jgi:5-hydroxyisourate hydrolase
MSAITTHVLDTVLGKPAVGVSIRLEVQQDGGSTEVATNGDELNREFYTSGVWLRVSAGATDADGRCRDLAQTAPAGHYRLTFFTGPYLTSNGRSGIYPEISITFACDGQQHYHLPLLLSDNSYTTYRGS